MCSGGGGLEEAVLSTSHSQTKSCVWRVLKVISAAGHGSAEIPRLEGRSGNSSNCKVKLTPPIILSVCVLSPFMDSLILLSKNKDMPMFPTPRPSALHLHAFFPLNTRLSTIVILAAAAKPSLWLWCMQSAENSIVSLNADFRRYIATSKA